ncbi:hypothetical protein MHBO_002404 [Bonamia ostreae]|uniref:Uncharacterized protein n=1 Tax=Bonamia ostreae TaxID=126728 RepID=A0ABV2AMA8_9EUKA
MNFFNFFSKKEVKLLDIEEIFNYVLSGDTCGNFTAKFFECKQQSENEDSKLLKRINGKNVFTNKNYDSDNLSTVLSTMKLTSLFDIDESNMFKPETKQLTSHLVAEGEYSSSRLSDGNSELSEYSSAEPQTQSSGNKKHIKSKEEIKANRKENKKAVKEEKRQKRQKKVPKKVKKRKEKLTKMRKNKK